MGVETADFGYTFEKAQELASRIVGMFKPESLEKAIDDARQEQIAQGLEGTRIQVFIPCNLEKFAPDQLLVLLKNPDALPLKSGESAQGENQIYGRRQEAYQGKVVSGRNHSAFLVYDSEGFLTDMIGRFNGASLINAVERRKYTEVLEARVGEEVAWFESPLGTD